VSPDIGFELNGEIRSVKEIFSSLGNILEQFCGGRNLGFEHQSWVLAPIGFELIGEIRSVKEIFGSLGNVLEQFCGGRNLGFEP
jgi:hypothetical protein